MKWEESDVKRGERLITKGRLELRRWYWKDRIRVLLIFGGLISEPEPPEQPRRFSWWWTDVVSPFKSVWKADKWLRFDRNGEIAEQARSGNLWCHVDRARRPFRVTIQQVGFGQIWILCQIWYLRISRPRSCKFANMDRCSQACWVPQKSLK